MGTNKMREQFEHHVRKGIWGEDATNEKCLCLLRHGEGYEEPGVNRDWLTWQASRKAVVVKLPEGMTLNELRYGSKPKPDHARLILRRTAASAIEAQGLKVAP